MGVYNKDPVWILPMWVHKARTGWGVSAQGLTCVGDQLTLTSPLLLGTNLWGLYGFLLDLVSSSLKKILVLTACTNGYTQWSTPK